jgi:hypothetical protein
MAIMAVFRAADFTKDQYEALRPIVQWESNPAAGCLFHACGFDEQGQLHVADIWESGEHLQAFFEQRLLPGFQQVGITDPPAPAILPLHNANVFSGLERYKV